jgi:DNA-binding response OmpR family regulator
MVGSPEREASERRTRWRAFARGARQAPPPARLRVAAIERDGGFLDGLTRRVRRLGWAFIVHPGPVTSATLLGGRPDAVLVDIGLLGPRWDDWLARQPARVPDLGVLVCTGRSTVGQRVRGLQVGADDWLTKPCHPEEVIARLQAIVRGRRLHLAAEEHTPLRRAELELRSDLFEVFVARRPAGLTRREFDVLAHLVRHEGEVLERERLYQRVWGFQMARGDRSIDTFVRKIRTKLRVLSPDWRYIHTHKGAGYSFDPEPTAGVERLRV